MILNNYDEDNQNYTRISELKNKFADNNRYLNDYFNEAELKTTDGFNDSTLFILSRFNTTGYDAIRIINEIQGSAKSLEEYLWIQSVLNSLLNYREEANSAIREHNNGINVNQNKANQMYEYINIYIDELLERTSQTREIEYAKLFSEWNKSKNVTVMLLIIMTILTFMTGSLLSGYITDSIKRIINLHNRVGGGDYVLDESERISDDEVGQLNQSFQNMQKNIKEQMDILNEKAIMEKRLYKEELLNIEMQKALNEAKYAMLQSQINPHFLFNTLNIISRKAMFNDSDAAVRLIGALSELFRHSLIDVSEKVTLEKELNVIQEYLYIQKARFGPRLTIEYINEVEDLNTILIPPLIIQPVVENAIVHGIEPLEQNGKITIVVEKLAKHIYIRVRDNGHGIDEDVIKKIKTAKKPGMGIGLPNVKQRLKYFSNEESFFIESSAEGTMVTLRFKLEE